MQLLRQRPKPFVLNGGLLKLPLQCGKSRNQQFKTDGGSIRSFHKMCSMTASNINYGIKPNMGMPPAFSHSVQFSTAQVLNETDEKEEKKQNENVEPEKSDKKVEEEVKAKEESEKKEKNTEENTEQKSDFGDLPFWKRWWRKATTRRGKSIQERWREAINKSTHSGMLKAMGHVPPSAIPVIFILTTFFFQMISQLYFGYKRYITFHKSVNNFCKIKHLKLLPYMVVDEERNAVLRTCGDEVTGLIGERGLGKTSAWVLAVNDCEWGRGKCVIDMGDADTTKQHWLDNWAKGIGYDMLSRNLKGSQALKGFLAKNVAVCCEEVTYAELIEYTENVMKVVKSKGYVPGPIFDGIREFTSGQEEISYLPLLENDIKKWLGNGQGGSRLACAFIGSTHESLHNGLPELCDSKRLKFVEFRELSDEKAHQIIDKYLEIYPILRPYEHVFKKFQKTHLGGQPYFINMAMRGAYTKLTKKACCMETKKQFTRIKNGKSLEDVVVRNLTNTEMKTTLLGIIYKINDIERRGEDETKMDNDEASYWDKAPESVIFRWAITFCFQAIIDPEFRKYILDKTNFRYVPQKRHEGEKVHRDPYKLTNLEYDTIFRYGLRQFPSQYMEEMVKERFLSGEDAINGEKILKMEETFLRANVLTKLYLRDCIKFSSTSMRKYIEEVIMLDFDAEFGNWNHPVFNKKILQEVKDRKKTKETQKSNEETREVPENITITTTVNSANEIVQNHNGFDVQQNSVNSN